MVKIEEIHSGDEPIRSVDEDNKQLKIITQEYDYFAVLSNYISVGGVTAPDFEEGQVLLYDAGATRDCARQLSLESAGVERESEASIKITLNYREKNTDADSSCDDSTDYSRPFRFFYINSRDLPIIEERLLE